MGQEIEFKYRLPREALPRLKQELGPWEPIEMETTYYDTPARAFAARRWTLRTRRENGRQVATLKTPGDGLVRGEWELEAAGIEAALPALLALGAPAELEALCAQGLEPVCGARFTRLCHLVQAAPGCRVELALDCGVVAAGARSAPLCELEAELKEGPVEAARAYSQALARRYGLEPEPLSKFERAHALEDRHE